MEKTYLDSLSVAEKAQVKFLPGGTFFKFGGETKLCSFEKIVIPCIIAGTTQFITADVIESNIPLLLSKEDMKRFNVKIDMQNDTADILGKDVNLDTTSSGQYCIALQSCEIPLEKVCFTVSEKSGDEKQKIVLKLYKQFVHPSADSLKFLMLMPLIRKLTSL